MKRKIDSLMGKTVYVDETALPVPEHSCRSCVTEADSVEPKEPEI